jgi:HEAT repeat protein
MTDAGTQAKIARLIAQLDHWAAPAKALHAIGPAAIPPLIEALRDPAIAEGALVALWHFRAEAAAAIPFVLPFLRAEDDRSRPPLDTVAMMLGFVGLPAVPRIVERFADASDREFQYLRRILQDIYLGSNLPDISLADKEAQQEQADATHSALIAGLKSHDPLTRRRVCMTLAGTFFYRHDASGPLIECLSDPDVGVRDAAASALRHDPKVVLDAFSAGDAIQREGCLKALGRRYRDFNASEASFFCSALEDQEPHVRIAAAAGLVQAALAMAGDAVYRELNNVDPAVRAEALRFCRRHAGFGDRAWRISDVVRCLSNPDPVIRREAAVLFVVCHCSRDSTEARTALGIVDEALRDRSETNRRNYLSALRHCRKVGSLLPAILDCLRDSDWGVAVCAANALGSFGVASDAVVAGLIEALDSKDRGVRSAAADALGDLKPVVVAALPKIIEILRSDDYNTILGSLEKFGPALAPATTEIVRLTRAESDEGPYILASIGTPETMVELCETIRTLGYGHHRVYEAAVHALHLIADRAKPFLKATIERGRPVEWTSALIGLERILEPAELAPYIVRMLRHGDSTGRQIFLRLLKVDSEQLRHFFRTPGAIDQLLDSLEDENFAIRILVLKVFAEWRTVDPIFLDVLLEVYREQIVRGLRRTADEVEGFPEGLAEVQKAAQAIGISIN